MSLNPSLWSRHAPVLVLHTDKCSSNHCNIQEIKAPALLLPWQFAVPLACRLLWDQTLQADLSLGNGNPDRWEGEQAQPGDKSNRAALPALLCGCAGHSAPSGIDARALSCVHAPFPGEGRHPVPQACCTPVLSWLCSLLGTAPSSDQGTSRLSKLPTSHL